MNVWIPARTLADPKAILLGLVVGLAVGSVGTYLAIGRTPTASASAGSNWKRPAQWAQDARLSKWQKLALDWYESHSDSPEIELLELMPTRTGISDLTTVVVFRAREKTPAGGVAVNRKVIGISDDGKIYEIGPTFRDNYAAAGVPLDDGLIMADRPR